MRPCTEPCEAADATDGCAPPWQGARKLRDECRQTLAVSSLPAKGVAHALPETVPKVSRTMIEDCGCSKECSNIDNLLHSKPGQNCCFIDAARVSQHCGVELSVSRLLKLTVTDDIDRDAITMLAVPRGHCKLGMPQAVSSPGMTETTGLYTPGGICGHISAASAPLLMHSPHSRSRRMSCTHALATLSCSQWTHGELVSAALQERLLMPGLQ